MKMAYYVADFETTTGKEETHVWAYATVEVGNQDNIMIGTTIDEFMQWCLDQKESQTIYFHNLKFDGNFILYWLFEKGFKHINEGEKKETNSFTTLISDKGLWYSIDLYTYIKGRNVRKIRFLDSLKLIPLSVDAIAKSFHLPIQKLKIDYSAHNDLPIGSPLTEEEKAYIINDVKIVATAIEYFHKQGLDKMTIGSCALEEYKKLISKKMFKYWYPTPTYHDDVKKSYRGGFTYLNPKFAEKTVKEGVVFDVNSLYPSVMRYEYLPYDNPIFFEGKYKEDDLYPLYIQMFRCSFDLKSGKIPTIQIKYGGFRGNEYLTTSGNKEVALCLNSVDMELFLNHYDVYNMEYLSGWKFKATRGLFDKYIDKWSDAKINAKKEGNHGMYLISKLFLNSLYGKFGTGNSVCSKVPFYDEDTGKVCFEFGEEKDKDGVYIPMASFITSYARLKTISSAQKIQDDYLAGKSDIQFIYADTDSLHCLSPNHKIPECLDVDATRLGAWKYESKFNKAKFLRQKCYIENSTEDINEPNPEYEMKITVAGMPTECHKQVTFKNFKIGASYQGKKLPKNVKGGVILEDVEFTIKPL